MPLAEFRFRPRLTRRVSRENLERVAFGLLAVLWQNGQTDREKVTGWVLGSFHVWCTVPAADFLEDQHATPWVRERLEETVAAFGEAPSVRILGDDRPLRAPSWRPAKALMLFTDSFDDRSPVCRGDLARRIPVYMLPLDEMERMHLQFWADQVREAHSLWLSGGVFEDPNYRQLADPLRPLLKTGQEFARLIEKRTGRPTYVFVMHYYGREGKEGRRRCPSCGGKWTRRSGRGPLSAWYFVIRCDPCRLATELAMDFDLPRLARVGDYVPSRRPSGSPRSTPRRAR